jgi:hypothetical protein
MLRERQEHRGGNLEAGELEAGKKRRLSGWGVGAEDSLHDGEGAALSVILSICPSPRAVAAVIRLQPA